MTITGNPDFGKREEEELKLSLLPTCGIVLVDETNTKRGGKDDYNSKSGLWQEGN